MITVVHLSSSSLAGTRQQFAADRIRIGRKSECDVHFDAQKDISVSGAHVDVRSEGARLFVRDSGSRNGTFVNDVRIEGEVEVKPDDVVRLGQNGPQLRLSTEASPTPATGTAPEVKQTIGLQTLRRVIKTERGEVRRNLLVVFGILALVAAGIVTWQVRRQQALDLSVLRTRADIEQTRQTADEARKFAEKLQGELERSLEDVRSRHGSELAALKGQISAGEGKVSSLIVEIEGRNRALLELERKTETETSAERALRLELETKLHVLSLELAAQEKALREQEGKAAPDWAGLAERYRNSLFLCLAQSAPDANGNFSQSIGTAWVCRGDGILASNAHVAEFMKDPSQWAALVCVQNDTGRIFDVQGVILHSRWNGGPDSPDVALIRIDTQGETLTALPLAEEGELRTLRIGTQLGTMGYPGELTFEYISRQSLNGELLSAQATFKDGWIGRILDFSGARAPFEESFSIQHSASLSGGTSGSPMFTANGRVVALNNAGRDLMVKVKASAGGDDEVKRMPNPAEIGYAVRVDLLQELLRDSGW